MGRRLNYQKLGEIVAKIKEQGLCYREGAVCYGVSVTDLYAYNYRIKRQNFREMVMKTPTKKPSKNREIVRKKSTEKPSKNKEPGFLSFKVKRPTMAQESGSHITLKTRGGILVEISREMSLRQVARLIKILENGHGLG